MEKLLEPVMLDEEFDDGYSKPKIKSRLTDKNVQPKQADMRDLLNTPLY